LTIFVEYIGNELYRTNITYFQVTGTPLRPCDQLLWQQTYVTSVNLAFEQFATAVGIYAANNSSSPWITFQ